MSVETAPCPVCGAVLTVALAEAVADPARSESCPNRPALSASAPSGAAPAAQVGSPP